MMRIGVVVVHYRTPALAESCVEALRRSEVELHGDLGDLAGGELEIVVVDNSAHAASAGRLGATAGGPLAHLESAYGVRLVEPPANLGYAGGVNRGVRELSRAEILVAMNPDVRVEPSCLPELVRALSADGVGVAGPRFFWDRLGGFLLPPAEVRDRRRELGRYLAQRRGGSPARRARAAWRRHAQRHWGAASDLPSHALSGALLAIDREAWNLVGPFDEGYRLYFEETDWLERARNKGVGGVYVPAAEALHGYARSTPREPRAEQWFAESEARFRRRWYGAAFASFLERVATRWPPRSEIDDGAPRTPPDAADGSDAAWVEISASPVGFPAVARRLGDDETDEEADEETSTPAAAVGEFVRRRAAEGALHWRTVDSEGRESATRTIDPLSAPSPSEDR